MSKPTRRQAMKYALACTVSVPVASLLMSRANAAGHMAKLDPEDPTAKALQYVEESPDPEKLCMGCQLYTGNEGDEYGPCSIFPGKEVAAKGWCVSWVAKAS